MCSGTQGACSRTLTGVFDLRWILWFSCDLCGLKWTQRLAWDWFHFVFAWDFLPLLSRCRDFAACFGISLQSCFGWNQNWRLCCAVRACSCSPLMCLVQMQCNLDHASMCLACALWCSFCDSLTVTIASPMPCVQALKALAAGHWLVSSI